jgi:hypothetical protein
MHKLTQEKLEAFLNDIRDEPLWRSRANKEMDYYDGNQLDNDTITQMSERGVAPLIRNLIGPTVDVVLGMEAKNKRDWKVVPEVDEHADFAEAMNVKLKNAERVSYADRACSDAYAQQVKIGVGWVEVARESNPLRSPYRVASVHRREMFWDWRAKSPDLADARFLVRKQWHDEDVLLLAFPGKKKLIKAACRTNSPIWQNVEDWTADLETAQSLEGESRTTLEMEEWRDADRHRVALFEVWYRAYARVLVMRLPDQTVVEYDEDNERHVFAVANEQVRLESAIIPKMRLSWWIGPHQLADIPSPYPHNQFPYIPFWGYKEDRTGIPYGLIRRMMSPQDEINARLSKMMWVLSAKRVIADADSLLWDHERVMDEVARPDAYILLNQNRKNKNADAFRVEQDFQLSAQQFQVLQDASKAINDTAGVYQAMLGKESSAESGIAINSLVEQGATTLAEINDNYRYARKQVGELLLSLVKEDIGNRQETVQVSFDGRRKNVTLNEMMVHPEHNYTYRNNDIALTRTRVELDDVPNTASYKAQQLMQLTEITKSLPPELQTIIVDLIVKATDLPQRHEIADRLARATGQKPMDMTPEEEQQYAAQQEEQKRERDLLIAAQEANVKKTEAETVLKLAQADKAEAETDALEDGSVRADEEHAMNVESQFFDNSQKVSQTEKIRAEAANVGKEQPKPKSSAGTSSSKK